MGTLGSEVAHLALHRARKGAQPPSREPFGQDLGDRHLHAAAISSGGKRLVADQVAAHDPQRAGKRQPVGIQVALQSGLVHQLRMA
jgi:hypothetical protein